MKVNDDAHKAASQLEAFFLRQLLAEARPSGGGAIDGGFAGDTFKQMLDEAIADKMAARGGIGMADMMAQQLPWLVAETIEHFDLDARDVGREPGGMIGGDPGVAAAPQKQGRGRDAGHAVEDAIDRDAGRSA